MTITAGTLDIDGVGPALSTATLTMSNGTLTGGEDLTVTGATTWTGGTMSGTGTTNADGGLTIGAAAGPTYDLALARMLNNPGAAQIANVVAGFTATTLNIVNGGTFVNEPGASFDFAGDNTFVTASTPGGVFLNEGAIIKEGTGPSVLGGNGAGPTLEDTGSIAVDGGTLSLQGGGMISGSATLSVAAGSVLDFGGGTFTAPAGSALMGTGAGTVTFSGATVTWEGTYRFDGTTAVSGGTVTFAAAASTGTYTQSAGITDLADGTLTATNPVVTIDGGILGGSGTVNGDVTNSGGQVIPGGIDGTGVLTIAGDYTQGSGASLTTNLGGPNPGSDYSQLTVTGRATLDGTLDVELIDGFSPPDHSRYTIVNYDPHSGQFANISSFSLPPGTTVTTNYTIPSLIITINSDAPLTSITVTPADPSVAEGLTQQFTAIGTYSDNSTADITGLVAWASANASVATVDGAGLATGVGVGTTGIGATLDGVSGTATLTVTAAVLVSISVTPADPSLAQGLTQQFTATGTYTDSSTQDLTTMVTWASSNTGVATITGAGLAAGVGVGTSAIGATLDGITDTAKLTVTAATTTTGNAPASADLSVGLAVTPNSVEVGQDLTFTLMVTNAGTTVATGATLTDVLPSGVTFVSATGGVCAGGRCPDLRPGRSRRRRRRQRHGRGHRHRRRHTSRRRHCGQHGPDRPQSGR